MGPSSWACPGLGAAVRGSRTQPYLRGSHAGCVSGPIARELRGGRPRAGEALRRPRAQQGRRPAIGFTTGFNILCS